MDENKEAAIDKLRKIVNWCDWMNESFNHRIKSISDLEKIFDYCDKHDLEFADNLDDKHAKSLNKLLGYEVYY